MATSVLRFVQALVGVVAQVRWEVIEQGTLEEIEIHALEIGRALATAFMLEAAVRLQERDARLVAEQPSCWKCGRAFEFSRRETMTFETHLGTLRTRRSYLACRGCKLYFHPLDAALQAPARGEVAPVFGTALSLLGVEVTYGTGSRLLASLANRKLDKSTIDRQVQRDGTCLQQLEREEADALWPYDEKGYPRTTNMEALRAKRTLLSLPPPAGRVLIMQGDGAMGNLAQEPDVKAEKRREQKKAVRKAREAKKAGTPQQEDTGDSIPSSFRESMQLVIYRLDDVVRKPVSVPKGQKRSHLKFRHVITRKQYGCVVNDPPMFAKQVNRLARLWDYKAYPERVFLGDGADKLWAASQEYFEPTTEILDINHARSHIHECARVLYDTKQAKTWGRRWCKHLEKHGPDGLLAHLRGLTNQSWSEAASKKLKALLEYCEEHEHRMSYPEFGKRGYPIASGAIEGANSHVFADRCRRSGQQWKRANLQALLSLRCASRDGRWEHVMQAVRRKLTYPDRALTTSPSITHLPLVKEEGAAPPPLPQQRSNRLERLIPHRKRMQILRASQGPSPLEPGSGSEIGGSP